MHSIAKGCWVLLIGAAVILFSLAGYLILSATNSAIAARFLQTISITAGLWAAVFVNHLIIGVVIWPFRKMGIGLGSKTQSLVLLVLLEIGAILFALSPLVATVWGPLTLAVAFRILVLPHVVGGGESSPVVEEADPLADTRPMAAVT